jgi:cell division protein FtsB
MKNINIQKLYYHFRHRYLTMNNVVITIALVIGASWAWGSIGMMQRNYTLQKEIDTKTRQQTLVELQVASLAYEQRYYQSAEYRELSARENLGLVDPGEKVLLLPPNTTDAKKADQSVTSTLARPALTRPGNFQQWANFLFGGNRRDLQK